MGCLSGVTVEPCLFFFALCHGMFVIIAQNLYIAKVCEVNLGFDKVICDNITHNKEEQVIVQKYVSELQAYSGILQVKEIAETLLFVLSSYPGHPLCSLRLVCWSLVRYSRQKVSHHLLLYRLRHQQLHLHHQHLLVL